MPTTRVLHLIDGLNIGGAEMLLLELSIGLKNRGYTVTVGYGTPGPLVENFETHGFPLIRIPRLARVDPLQFYKMYKLVKDFAPHIVHTHLFKSDFHGRFAAYLAGAPVIVSTLHSIDLWAENWVLGRLYGLSARPADRLIAVSENVKHYFVANAKIIASKISVIENGIDTNRFIRFENDQRKIREEFGLNGDDIVFGIIGRLTVPKDHETFIYAASSILKQRPDSRFLIVGDGPLRKTLHELVVKLGLKKFVIFTGLRHDIHEILNSLDVLVISSKWEGLPIALLEGMATSLPIVATSVGGIPSVLTNDIGIVVPHSNPSAISDACVMLANNYELRQKMGFLARRRVVERYSIDAMVDRTVYLYDELRRNHHPSFPVSNI